jgi:hypothetical protein
LVQSRFLEKASPIQRALNISCLELHLEIDNEERLQKKIYDKRDDFTFPIVNFPFTSNISASAAYAVYISLLIRYSGWLSTEIVST